MTDTILNAMIITCENCDSSFRVPKDAIGESGRLVKCSSCDYEWIVKPDPLDLSADNKKVSDASAAPEIAKVANEPEQANKSSSSDIPQEKTEETKKVTKSEQKKKPPKRFVAPPVPYHKRPLYRYVVYATFAASLLLMLTQLFINSHSSLSAKSSIVSKFYKVIGMYDISGLVLEKVDCTISEIRSSKDLGDNIEVEVDAYIKNISEKAKVIKYIRFMLFDDQREYLGDLVMELGATIKPNENYHIEGVLNRVPKNSYYVSIDYGNYIELMYKNMNLLHD